MDERLGLVEKTEGGLRLRGHNKSSQPGEPLISIVLPVYNAAAMLERSLSSVVHQNYANIEIVIIDGGSSDRTLEVIRAAEESIDYWASQPDDGVYDAMNRGVEAAKGDWVHFLGAGDILVNCLHKVAGFLRSGRTIYYGDVYLPGKNKTYDGKFDFSKLIAKNINHQAIFYPRKLFDYYKYDLKYEILADYELNLKCWADRRFRFRYVPVLVCIHNEQGLSMRTVDARFQEDKPGIVRRNFGNRIFFHDKYLQIRRLIGSTMKALGLKEPIARLLNWTPQ